MHMCVSQQLQNSCILELTLSFKKEQFREKYSFAIEELQFYSFIISHITRIAKIIYLGSANTYFKRINQVTKAER